MNKSRHLFILLAIVYSLAACGGGSSSSSNSDTAGVTVSTISSSTTEAGGTATFTVVLDTQPTDNVSIAVTSSNTEEGAVSAASLTFASGNWDTAQTITVTGVDDPAVDGSIAYTIVLAAATSTDTNYSGINPADVSVINTDNDSLNVSSWSGTKQLGVASADTFGRGVATDSSGNVFVAGDTTGSLYGNTLTGTSDFFVTKYDSFGNYQWMKQLGVASAGTSGNGLATDSNGNIFVAGNTSGSLDGQTLAGTTDFFVTKYDTNGTKEWTRQLGVASAATSGIGVATDSSDSVFVAGDTDGSLDGNTRTGITDIYVTKYDTNGTKQWTEQLGAALAFNLVMGVASDGSNVFVTGFTSNDLDSQTVTGDTDLFVVKYDTGGVKQWTRLLGVVSAGVVGLGVTTDGSGNVFVTGFTDGDLDGTLTGTQDFFVTKYDSTGAIQWTRQLGFATKDTTGNGVATDSSGNVFVTGVTDGDLDTNTLTGTEDFFVTKYNAAGTKQWTKLLGVASKSTTGLGVATDSGNVFVAGVTDGGLDGNTLTGTQDFFVTKYDSTGTKQ